MTTEALRQSHKVGALGLHADARNLTAIHLIHDLLQRIVVPHDDRKREAFLRRRGELIDREHDPAVARNGDHRPMRRADLGADGHRKGDAEGNLTYRKTARNFNPMMATAGKLTLAEVEHLVPMGALDKDAIHTPGIFVTRIIDGSPYSKPIEKRTNRKRTEGSHAVVS